MILLRLLTALILPAWAFTKIAHPIAIAYLLGISIITFLAYGMDKRRAKINARRIPEASLHLMELIGGWPAAWLAQQTFRHKTSKRSYRIIFWLIVGVYQGIAIDCLMGWKYASALAAALT